MDVQVCVWCMHVTCVGGYPMYVCVAHAYEGVCMVSKWRAWLDKRSTGVICVSLNLPNKL